MTPLILLVGFLGAGKTTYLREFLPQLRSRGLDPHVIINDYQNARVDAEQLRELAGSIVPISGSCVCCGSREELTGAMSNFQHAPNRVLVIETNGTTDSGELIEILAIDPALRSFTPPIQLSVIDGQRWQKRFWHNALELAQVRTAGYLFISRQEEIGPARQQKVEESLASHGLNAPRVDPAALAAEIAAVAGAVENIPARSDPAHPDGCACHHHEHHEPHDAHHFASLQIDLPDVVSRRALETFLSRLPREVIRVKGLARLSESSEEYHVFQRVDDAATQWLPVGRVTRLSHPLVILIGPSIDPEPIRALSAGLFES